MSVTGGSSVYTRLWQRQVSVWLRPITTSGTHPDTSIPPKWQNNGTFTCKAINCGSKVKRWLVVKMRVRQHVISINVSYTYLRRGRLLGEIFKWWHFPLHPLATVIWAISCSVRLKVETQHTTRLLSCGIRWLVVFCKTTITRYGFIGLKETISVLK